MKMTFTCEHYNWDDFTGKQKEPISKINFETKNDNLEDVLSDFEMFLRGCGYFFDGHLDIINEDIIESYQAADNSTCGDCENCVCESSGSPEWSNMVNSLQNPPTFRAAGLTGQNS